MSKFVGTVPDDYERTRGMLLETVKNYDVIFTTDGVSVGERNFVADIMEEAGELFFHWVKIRPGKPLAVGVVKGKPTGAFTAMELVVRRYFTDTPKPTLKLIVE